MECTQSGAIGNIKIYFMNGELGRDETVSAYLAMAAKAALLCL